MSKFNDIYSTCTATYTGTKMPSSNTYTIINLYLKCYNCRLQFSTVNVAKKKKFKVLQNCDSVTLEDCFRCIFFSVPNKCLSLM